MDQDFSEDRRMIDAIEAVPSILEIVCQSTGMGFAAVARVTQQRWLACSVRDEIGFGLKAGEELDITTTICHEIHEHRGPVIIDHVAQDAVYRDHRTPKLYGLQSYISMPIILPDGSFFGTLCAISPKPAQVSKPHVVAMFRLFADVIGQNIHSARSLAASRHALLDANNATDLREQFIAVLGHDLRNPLAAIQGGMRLLGREQLSARGQAVTGMVDETVRRMAGIIDNVMDFARGKLGGGIALNPTQGRVEHILAQVADELITSHPERAIVTDFNVPTDIRADHSRLGQLFSNLLGNALTHGAADQPIRARAHLVDGHLEISTTNGGDPIPASAMDRLFAPFHRGDSKAKQEGLGLGLYIASQIAQAHGGSLTASSTAQETTFRFRMPVDRP